MKYRPEIDGLRAVAVVPVLFFHAGLPFFHGGYLGVDVFFVISGYLITSIISVQIEEERFSIVDFWLKRVRRLQPVLAVVVLTTLIAGYFLSLPAEWMSTSATAVATSAYASNVWLWLSVNYFAPAAELNPLLHTWSLSVEEQFYLFYPALMMLCTRWFLGWRRSILVVVALTSLVFSEWASSAFPTANFYLTTSRLWELLFGSILALEFRSRSSTSRFEDGLAWAGLAAVVISMLLLDGQSRSPGLVTLPTVVGTGLLLVCGHGDRGVGRWMAHPLLVRVGLLSYGLYLWHQPILAYLRRHYVRDLSFGAGVGAILASFVFAALTYRFVENPIRYGTSWTRGRTLGFLVSSTLLVGGLGGLIIVNDGFVGRLDPARAAHVVATVRSEAERSCLRHLRSVPSEACRFGADGSATWIVIGDSHAGALVGSLDVELRERGIAAEGFIASACPIATDVVPVSGLSAPCGDIFEEGLARARELGASATVVLANRWARYHTGAFDDGEGCHGVATRPHYKMKPGRLAMDLGVRAGDFIQRVRDTGARTFVVEGVPEHGCDAVDAATRPLGSPIELVHSVESHRVRNAPVVRFLDGIEGITRIDPVDSLCDSDRCSSLLGDDLLYRDAHHISTTGSDRVVDLLLRSADDR